MLTYVHSATLQLYCSHSIEMFTYRHQATGIRMFSMVPYRNNTNVPTVKWINKPWFIHTEDAAMKQCVALSYTATEMNPTDIVSR